MNTEKMKRLMSRFSMEELISFLGNEIYDSLVEWKMDGEFEFTKKQLSTMILTIKGINILKEHRFREKIIEKLSEAEINSFKPILFGEVEKLTAKGLIPIISRVKWVDNKVSKRLLELLEIDENIFEKRNKDSSSIAAIDPYDKFFELLDYQYVIRQRILTNLNSAIKLKRMLVHMPTGTGKTKTMMHTLINHFTMSLNKKGLIIWVAHSIELLQQAYDTFISVWKHLGQGTVQTYKLWGDNDISEINCGEANGIVFCGIQKLAAVQHSDEELFNNLVVKTKLIVFDEAHKASAPETSKVINSFMFLKGDMPDRALVGLTATPGRSTELGMSNELLVSMFGNRIIGIDTKIMNDISLDTISALNAPVEEDIIKFLQDRQILAKVKKEELAYPVSFNEDQLQSIRNGLATAGYQEQDFSNKALQIIGRNQKRNKAIMIKLRDLNEHNVPTIVFACSVAHGQLLSSMLTMEGIPNCLVIGAMAAQERKDAIDSFKDRDNPINIIINFEVLTTGFDATNIKCVFITRPTQSVVLYSQMIGRGLRGPQMGGNAECLLIDIKDNIYKYDENRAFNHFNNYWIN